MSRSKPQASFMNVGASSLLVIFLILCISVFATLSLSGAKSDAAYTQRMADHKTDYYQASGKASLVLDAIDSHLAAIAPATDNASVFYVAAPAGLAEAVASREEIADVQITITEQEGIPSVSWQIPVNDTQVLNVRLLLHWPYDTPTDEVNGFYQIVAWQTADRETP